MREGFGSSIFVVFLIGAFTLKIHLALVRFVDAAQVFGERSPVMRSWIAMVYTYLQRFRCDGALT